ncbi:MAG: hypothetical protein K0Q93_3147 [Nocardioidaceae bacterium]|nr:hypothetical protein [Nocardioidaceae bacterium]
MSERHNAHAVQVGDTIGIPAQPPIASRVKVNGHEFMGLVFERVSDTAWWCPTITCDWPQLLTAAGTPGVTVLRVGPE